MCVYIWIWLGILFVIRCPLSFADCSLFSLNFLIASVIIIIIIIIIIIY